MTTALDILGPDLTTLPDGETGERRPSRAGAHRGAVCRPTRCAAGPTFRLSRAPPIPCLPTGGVPVSSVGDGTLGSEETLVVPHHQMRHPRQNQLVASRASIRLVRTTHRANLPDRSVGPGVHATRPAQHAVGSQLPMRFAIRPAAGSACHLAHCLPGLQLRTGTEPRCRLRWVDVMVRRVRPRSQARLGQSTPCADVEQARWSP